MSPIGQLLLLGITGGSLFMAANHYRAKRKPKAGTNGNVSEDDYDEDGTAPPSSSSHPAAEHGSVSVQVPPCLAGVYEPGRTLGESGYMANLSDEIRSAPATGGRYPTTMADAMNFRTDMSIDAMAEIFSQSSWYHEAGNNPLYPRSWLDNLVDSLAPGCDWSDPTMEQFQRKLRGASFGIATLAKANSESRGY
jgi:hypothetical protein